MVVYTGILSFIQNEPDLVIIMGHEITHAVAHHAQERISQAFVAQIIRVGADVFTSSNPTANNIFKSIYMPGAQVAVLLPNSRNQEYEANHYCLIFAAMSGYNPKDSIQFWTRMSQSNAGSKTPEIPGDHPFDANRIEKINRYMPEAMKFYRQVTSKN